MKTIHVSDETWKSLQQLKLEKGYRTLEDVISRLLSDSKGDRR